MKISTRVRYGTRLMLELGLLLGKGPILLKNIASKEDISEKYLSQIIIPLKTAGLVRSFRGAKGGYVLGKALKKITILEIVEAIEGPISLIGAEKNENSFKNVSISVTRYLWNQVEDRINQTLSAVTLADLVKDCREKEEATIMYDI